MFGTDLSNWLSGGSRNRELAETRREWQAVETLWRASPLARTDRDDIVLSLVREAQDTLTPRPSVPFLVALAGATDAILDGEHLGAIEAKWDVIEHDVEAAVEFREMMRQRRRWAGDYDRMHGIARRLFFTFYQDIHRLVSESCQDAWEGDGEAAFEVPLIELLEDPVAGVERMLLFPYDDDTLALDVFRRLREAVQRNLLVASGFLPTDNPAERHARLIFPRLQKDKTPADLAETYLAGTPFAALAELPVPFRIPDEIRFEHCHIVGGTGHGKTQLMQRMIHADLLAAMRERRSVVVIDSQGDLINRLTRLDLFDPGGGPDSLADRLVLIDPYDVENPAALNLFDFRLDRLKDYTPADRERVLNGVVEVYETFFGALLGAELTQKQGVIFKYLARLMLEIPGATIHTLMQLMEDGRPFREHMRKLDGSARWFFEKEFFDPSFSATKKQILKRLWGVLSTPAFERMFAQRENKLDLFAALNEGKIVLISTAKDLLKREGSELFGRFFIALLAQAALERSVLDPDDRTPTFVYVDEAQEYFDDSIETILNQARKYRVGLTLAHQTLDQLTPRLRSSLLSNTSIKCAGGVSAKDARALADELHTSSAFIESMRRRGGKTEFAVWLKQKTSHAIRLAVPLGYLERQRVLTEEAFDALIAQNRVRYCGTLADVVGMPAPTPRQTSDDAPELASGGAVSFTRDVPDQAAADVEGERDRVADDGPIEMPISAMPAEQSVVRPRRPPEAREMGKGGPKHRYLQNLVKEIAEQHGFRAVIEAPLSIGPGQVDVLLSQGDISAAIEVSVTTPADWERENIRKCLNAGHERVALVLAKTASTQARYRAAVLDGMSVEERERVTFLLPEDIPDYIASLAPIPDPTETVVRGYRVRVTHSSISPEESKARRDALARVIATSLGRQG